MCSSQRLLLEVIVILQKGQVQENILFKGPETTYIQNKTEVKSKES